VTRSGAGESGMSAESPKEGNLMICNQAEGNLAKLSEVGELKRSASM
jgi:hypothetical protein